MKLRFVTQGIAALHASIDGKIKFVKKRKKYR